MENNLIRVTTLAGEFIKSVIEPGDIVVDATAGTGEDTLLLAQCTGGYGSVYAFDIQKAALEQVKEKLEKNGLESRVVLIHHSHEELAEVLALKGINPSTVKAIVFNLGYLPNGDHHIVTSDKTTLRALEAALTLLAPRGIITVALYPGHPGGQQEAEAVLNWCETLKKPFVAHHFRTLNRKSPPTLVIIQRMR
ncbi:class I SAM-dependent methyltransferase [Acetobacterium bakii]|uniref:class I SAM-dependent methyltransferase n=1 Tax=Acetobacterium bakii TaxID=52689 RepID=UPI001364B80B|nr:class I SAM-dependent methyltransferase [Acetobacterium bakii]